MVSESSMVFAVTQSSAAYRWGVICESFPSYRPAASTQCLGLDAPGVYPLPSSQLALPEIKTTEGKERSSRGGFY